MSDATPDPAVTGESWADFCDSLKAAGDKVLERSTEDLDRLEGFRYLSRLARGGLQAFLENGEPPFADILPIAHNLKIGCDNPDALYTQVPIDPRYDYRIHGPRGTVNYLSIGAYSGGYASGASKPGMQGHIEDNDPDPAGRIDLIASVEEPARLEPGQRWLRMEAVTTTLIIRNFYLDRSNERPSELTLDCLNPPAPGPGPLTAKKLNHGLGMAGLYVHGIVDMFQGWMDDFAERPNTLEFLDKEDGAGGWGDPNQLFRHGSWALEPGRAIIVDVPKIEAYYWNFQLNNMWEESLDYRHCQVTVNKHTARYEADGSVRLIIADEDPGFGNWIDTAAHRHGSWGLRYNQVVEDIPPTITIVDVADLAE
jgi:hypothetical protein